MASGSGAGLLGLVKSFAPTYEWYLVGELLETIMGASVYPAAFVLSKIFMYISNWATGFVIVDVVNCLCFFGNKSVLIIHTKIFVNHTINIRSTAGTNL